MLALDRAGHEEEGAAQRDERGVQVVLAVCIQRGAEQVRQVEGNSTRGWGVKGAQAGRGARPVAAPKRCERRGGGQPRLQRGRTHRDVQPAAAPHCSAS